MLRTPNKINSMIAYCGIDCSRCKSFIATQSGNNEKLVQAAAELSKVYCAEVKPEYVICDGCRQGKRHSYYCSNMCKMKKCCIENKFNSCIECHDYPCKELQFELNNNPDAKDNLEKMKADRVIYR